MHLNWCIICDDVSLCIISEDIGRCNWVIKFLWRKTAVFGQCFDSLMFDAFDVWFDQWIILLIGVLYTWLSTLLSLYSRLDKIPTH